MDFTTKVQITPHKEGLTYKNKILMLGSCFADEVGKYLKDYRFQVMVNPFGTLYNPCSIANAIERLAIATEFTPEDVIESNGIFTSFYHHSSIFGTTPEEFLTTANNQLRTNAFFFKEADAIIITLGTAHIYTHPARRIVVSNCHKIKASAFERRLLDKAEISTELQKITDIIAANTQCQHIIFTVSPIRHLKDGAHANQLSKAALLLAVEQLILQSAKAQEHTNDSIHLSLTHKQSDSPKPYPTLSYFPAYEIMMDELRDYRFYAADMVHPSPLAIEYIFHHFTQTFISQSARTLMNEAIRLTKAQNHRPLFPETPQYLAFQKRLQEDLEKFNKKIKE
ncbi:MAG: GSCFA domain-containing protein [Bacteroidales bacterium]